METTPKNEPPRLWNWVKDVAPHSNALAWCHTTRAHLFRDMVESGECRIQLCKVFAEELLYFFYGRPAYKIGNDPMWKSSSLPVVLLFDPSLVEFGKRLFPFDSGAFHENRLERWMDPAMKLDHFQLECGIEPLKRFVRAFYESNDHYLRTRVRKDIAREIKQYGAEFEVSALVRLLQEAGEGTTDNRAMAAELQLATSVLLGPQHLKAIIYPDELEQAEWFNTFLARFKEDIKWDRYEPQPSKLCHEYQGHLEERARVIQGALGYV
jgi:hypothetical protein